MSASRQHPSFDFETWSRLARSNPEEFENRRNRLIEQAINDAPERIQQRLRCLQWKLDRIRDTAPSPMAACQRMYTLLWKSVDGENGLRARLQYLKNCELAEKEAESTAKILEFRR